VYKILLCFKWLSVLAALSVFQTGGLFKGETNDVEVVNITYVCPVARALQTDCKSIIYKLGLYYSGT